MSDEEQRRALEELYSTNLERLNAAIGFCEEQGIKLYRLTSSLFPFADERAGEEALDGFSEAMRKMGERAIYLGIRLVMHPDQFVVLNSDSEAVIENSIKILRTTKAFKARAIAQKMNIYTLVLPGRISTFELEREPPRYKKIPHYQSYHPGRSSR